MGIRTVMVISLNVFASPTVLWRSGVKMQGFRTGRYMHIVAFLALLLNCFLSLFPRLEKQNPDKHTALLMLLDTVEQILALV